MADDEFDIDIYGDTNTEQDQDGSFKKDDEGDIKIDGIEAVDGDADTAEATNVNGSNRVKQKEEQDDDYVDIKVANDDHDKMNGQQQIKSTDESGQGVLTIPKQAPQQQGVKRKEGSDDRPIDPGATTALLISELHWWNTDDDVRGWVNQAQVEDELKDITFSEHKINGKSKGQAYVEFTSQQAATAAKHKIDAFGEGQQYVKKHTVTYSNPNNNPFRTLPKDAPMRAGKDGPNNRAPSNNYSNDRGNQNSNFGGFRGRTPGYNTNRGGMNSNLNGNHFTRNFSGPAIGGNMGAGFNPSMGGGFPNNPMGGQFGGGGFNRGGMMGGMRGGSGMRGGRGGMNNMMGGMPMGGMPMGGMPGVMGMPMNMGQMGGMQGMANPIYTYNQPYIYSGQNAVQNGKAHPANIGQIPARSNTPLHSQYQSSIGVPGSSPFYGNPHSSRDSYMRYQKVPQTKTQSNHAGGGGFQPHFNPAFFPQNQAAGGDWQNPHGAKRPRPE